MEGVEAGIRRVVWLPSKLDIIIEETRKELGLNRSAFIRNAILTYLEAHSIISTKLEPVKEAIRNSQRQVLEVAPE